MIVVMNSEATSRHVATVIARVEADGYQAHLAEGDNQTLIGVVGHSATPLKPENYATMDGVDKIVPVNVPYQLASRTFHPHDTLVQLNGSQMGGNKVLVIAGPCSVESREQIIETACAMKEAGATALRGGAFKPRTSPYSFQGHGEKGLQWLAEARQVTGLPIVTEVMDPALVPMVCQYADVLQIGARNMQNFTLLNAAGESQQTVLIKRGMSSSIEDLLMAAEYVLAKGNERVILCERGIRTFETFTRNTFDLNAIPVLKHLTHLPIIADPSHAVGKSEYVDAVARAAVAAGADGVIVEVHMNPAEAMSDGRQSLTPQGFQKMMDNIRRVAEAVDRTA
ncbi:MAG TPA: 3-deoxy-7-phosphoheptulonate synthase [Phototrophicaceae bacterium]|jgi:3-deoxy-7-phosphoheptulonate synthase|nr:3-deoxy-7-phosphoheptulonate synthase [Phototrophicaceae bacterium]